MHILRIIKSVILWSYERGTWQYDVLCILILVFIFLTPNSFFNHRDSHAPKTSQSQPNPSTTALTAPQSDPKSGEILPSGENSLRADPRPTIRKESTKP